MFIYPPITRLQEAEPASHTWAAAAGTAGYQKKIPEQVKRMETYSSNSYKKTAFSDKGGGDWVTYETDMGPVPRGTPCMRMKHCMQFEDGSGVDCVLFWANPHVDSRKKDGNVWMLGECSKCKKLDGPKHEWPGGEQAKKSTERLLIKLFKKRTHVQILLMLELLMQSGATGTAVIDGEESTVWSNAA